MMSKKSGKIAFFHYYFPDCYITEEKYWNQLKKIRKFRVVLSSGSHETGGTAKKVTASDSAKSGPRIHIFFFNSGVTGTRRNGDKE